MTKLTVVQGSDLRAVRMPLYPTMGSLVEAITYIESQAPLTTPNQIFVALMTYHNTLLAQLERDLATPPEGKPNG